MPIEEHNRNIKNNIINYNYQKIHVGDDFVVVYKMILYVMSSRRTAENKYLLWSVSIQQSPFILNENAPCHRNLYKTIT